VEKPFISVIVIAYNRKEFLLQAVSSALRQTLPRDFYEVIVVKNFEDEEIDRQLGEWGVKWILSEPPGHGEHLAAALEEAKGEVLSFLDDDDMFSDKKLEAVRSAFQREDVVFLRNRHVLIDAKGRVIGEETAHPAFETKGSDEGALRRLIAARMGFNSSSISIRRSTLEALGVSKFKELNNAVDSFYLVASLLYGGTLVYDPLPLTLYRIHGNQTFNRSSLDAYVRRRCDYANKYIHAYEMMMGLIGNSPYEVVIKPLLIRSKIASAVFCPSGNKPTIQELAYLIKQRKNTGLKDREFLLLLGLMAASVLPPLRGLARRTEFEFNNAIRRAEAQFGKAADGSPAYR